MLKAFWKWLELHSLENISVQVTEGQVLQTPIYYTVLNMSDTSQNILALGGSLKQREQAAAWPLSTLVVEGVRGCDAKGWGKEVSQVTKRLLETLGA